MRTGHEDDILDSDSHDMETKSSGYDDLGANPLVSGLVIVTA